MLLYFNIEITSNLGLLKAVTQLRHIMLKNTSIFDRNAAQVSPIMNLHQK